MEEEIEWVSKTQMKKIMIDLQDLGLRLAKLSKESLAKAPVNDDLIVAINDYKKIKSNSALKRQNQYIGRLMRDLNEEEVEAIKAYFSALDGDNKAHKAYIQRLELLRERLLADDDALTQYLTDYPNVDIAELRTLIRNARKEKEANKPPKAYRALFKFLKTTGDSSNNVGG